MPGLEGWTFGCAGVPTPPTERLGGWVGKEEVHPHSWDEIATFGSACFGGGGGIGGVVQAAGCATLPTQAEEWHH